MNNKQIKLIALLLVLLIAISVYSIAYLKNPSIDPEFPIFVRNLIIILTIFLITGNKSNFKDIL